MLDGFLLFGWTLIVTGYDQVTLGYAILVCFHQGRIATSVGRPGLSSSALIESLITIKTL